MLLQLANGHVERRFQCEILLPFRREGRFDDDLLHSSSRGVHVINRAGSGLSLVRGKIPDFAV